MNQYSDDMPEIPEKILIAGWFSFKEGHATAGDVLAGELVRDWLAETGYTCELAFDPPFTGGVDWRTVDPETYSHVIFVCGPFQDGALERAFLARFGTRRLIGLDLTMLESLERFNPFDLLLERDSTRAVHPDLVFASRRPLVPVVGICRVEAYPGGHTEAADAAIGRLVASRPMAAVEIDTRLDVNTTGLRNPQEIESLLARMDVVVTTRLHGMVLALKNGVPVVVIDPEPGGAKICRQAERIGWPFVFPVDTVTDTVLIETFDRCILEDSRRRAAACGREAAQAVESIQVSFIEALRTSESLDAAYTTRLQSGGTFNVEEPAEKPGLLDPVTRYFRTLKSRSMF